MLLQTVACWCMCEKRNNNLKRKIQTGFLTWDKTLNDNLKALARTKRCNTAIHLYKLSSKKRICWTIWGKKEREKRRKTTDKCPTLPWGKNQHWKWWIIHHSMRSETDPRKWQTFVVFIGSDKHLSFSLEMTNLCCYHGKWHSVNSNSVLHSDFAISDLASFICLVMIVLIIH